MLSFWDVRADGASRPGRRRRGAARLPRGAARASTARCPVLGGLTEAEALLTQARRRGGARPRAGDRAAAPLRGPARRCSASCARRSSRCTATRTSATCSARGPLWNDWEDTCLGPVGWDAACLISCAATAASAAEAAYAASGIAPRPGGAELWVEARALQVEVWRAFWLGRDRHELAVDARLDLAAVDEQVGEQRAEDREAGADQSAPSGSPRSARSAARCRPRASESRRELAIAARIARPSAPPICWQVLIRPDARPASCGSTPATAAIVIGTNAKPEAEGRDQRREQDVADVGAADRDLREPAAGRSRSAAGRRSAPA